MIKGGNYYSNKESPIFSELSIYKVLYTKKKYPVIVHMDGSISVIATFKPINVNKFNENDFEELFNVMTRSLTDIDDTSTSVQFLMVRKQANKMDGKDINQIPDFLRPRAEYLNFLVDTNQLFENEYLYCVHVANRSTMNFKESLLKKIKKTIWKNKDFDKSQREDAFVGVDDRLTTAIDTAVSIGLMLADIGSSFRLLQTKDEYYTEINKFTRPQKSKFGNVSITDESEKYESPRQALFSGVKFEGADDHFVLDDYYHKVYTLDRMPITTIYGKSISVLSSFPAEFIYSVTFRRLSHKETLNTFKLKTAIADAIVGQDKDAIVKDKTKQKHAEKIEGAYDTWAEGNTRGLEISANFILRIYKANAEAEMKRDGKNLKEYFSSLDQKLIKRVFANFGESEWSPEITSHWSVFNKIIPGFSNAYSIELKKMLVLSQAVPYFLSFYTNRIIGCDDHFGTNHFVDLSGAMIPFDLMNPMLPAWNYSISGQTGSGKSVLMNTILVQQFARSVKGKSPVICIIDLGGDLSSYQKIIELTKGEKIKLASAVKPRIQLLEINPSRSLPTIKKTEEILNKLKELLPQELIFPDNDMKLKISAYYNLRLNLAVDQEDVYNFKRIFDEAFLTDLKGIPIKTEFEFLPQYTDIFKLREGECKPDQSRCSMICSVFDIILADADFERQGGFSFFNEDEFLKLLFHTYELIGDREKRFPRISDMLAVFCEFYDGGSESGQTQRRQFKTKLENWTVNGRYPMFDQPTSINLNNDVILADLKGLENEPKLQTIYTMLISNIFADKMYFIRDRVKVVVRDEAWSLMKNKRARASFEEDLRTARKNGFATIAISQLPTDYNNPDREVGKAIIGNMQCQIFCKFNSTTICEEIAREFNLDESLIDELKDLGLKKVLMPDGSYHEAYSKFMMVIDGAVYVLKNELHPFEYQLYSSSADDNAVINYYMNKTRKFDDLYSCLFFLSNKGHYGDKDLQDFLYDCGKFKMLKRLNPKYKR